MKIAVSLIFGFLFLTLLASCMNGEDYRISQGDSSGIIIATFNIKWLGDGYDDEVQRNEDDLKKIANIIDKINPDIIALQEVENSSSLDKLTKYLDGYDHLIAPFNSKQNCAFLYKNSTVTVRDANVYLPIDVRRGITRPGYLLKVKAGNFDFEIMNVHFKSTSRYDDTPEKRLASFDMRREQSKAVVHWADSVINHHDKDVIILGDFNDSPIDANNQTLNAIIEGNLLLFLSSDFKSCKYKGWNSIDHIVVSQSANMRVVDNSLLMLDLNSMFTEAEIESISDHCPLFCKFDVVTKDND